MQRQCSWYIYIVSRSTWTYVLLKPHPHADNSRSLSSILQRRSTNLPARDIKINILALHPRLAKNPIIRTLDSRRFNTNNRRSAVIVTVVFQWECRALNLKNFASDCKADSRRGVARIVSEEDFATGGDVGFYGLDAG